MVESSEIVDRSDPDLSLKGDIICESSSGVDVDFNSDLACDPVTEDQTKCDLDLSKDQESQDVVKDTMIVAEDAKDGTSDIVTQHGLKDTDTVETDTVENTTTIEKETETVKDTTTMEKETDTVKATATKEQTNDGIKDTLTKPKTLTMWKRIKLLNERHSKKQNTICASEVKAPNNDLDKDEHNMHNHEGYKITSTSGELNGDLRNLPIIIDELSDEYTQMIKTSKAIMGFKEAATRCLDPDVRQLRRQEQKLKVFTSYYDCVIGEYVSCDELKERSYCPAIIYNESWEQFYKKGKGERVMKWLRGVVRTSSVRKRWRRASNASTLKCVDNSVNRH